MAGGGARELVCSRAALSGLTGRWAPGRDTSNPCPRTGSRAACTPPGCRLPPRRDGLCGHCAAVHAAAAERYHQLAAREMARLELDHPGLEHAARIASRAAERRRPAPAAAPAPQDPAITRSAQHGPLPDWQIARLEQFIAQLRTLATTRAGGPA